MSLITEASPIIVIDVCCESWSSIKYKKASISLECMCRNEKWVWWCLRRTSSIFPQYLRNTRRGNSLIHLSFSLFLSLSLYIYMFSSSHQSLDLKHAQQATTSWFQTTTWCMKWIKCSRYPFGIPSRAVLRFLSGLSVCCVCCVCVVFVIFSRRNARPDKNRRGSRPTIPENSGSLVGGWG